MNYIAICFTDEKYVKTRERYKLELLSKNLFSKVIAYGTEDIDESFSNAHGAFISSNPKGYGYYIWKPYFILKTLKAMDDGDVLVYGDAGNDMPGSPEECLAIFDSVNHINKGVKILAAKQGYNIRWTKSDLYFTMGWTSLLYVPKFMAEAARIVFKKDPNTIEFVEEWLRYVTSDYHNIDDTPSKLPNFPFFIAHRYDQSIFSILFHKYKGTRVDFGNTWRAQRLRF